MHENREISSTPSRVCEGRSAKGHKPNGGHARAGEVGLRRNTCEPTEQGKATSCGGRGGKGAAGGEHRSTAHAPDSEQESACPSDWTVSVKQVSVTGSLSRHSSFRRAVCVDAHVRICAGGAQRWASLPRQLSIVEASNEGGEGICGRSAQDSYLCCALDKPPQFGTAFNPWLYTRSGHFHGDTPV